MICKHLNLSKDLDGSYFCTHCGQIFFVCTDEIDHGYIRDEIK